MERAFHDHVETVPESWYTSWWIQAETLLSTVTQTLPALRSARSLWYNTNRELSEGRVEVPTYVRYIAGICAAYAAVTALTYMALEEPSLIDIVTGFHLVSLALLLLANGEANAKHNDHRPRVRRANTAILIVSVVLLVLEALHFLHVSFEETEASGVVKNLLIRVEYNLFWLSAAPLFLYGALDVAIMYLTKYMPGADTGDTLADHDEIARSVAKQWIVFVDVPSMLPLGMLIVISGMLGRAYDGIDQELFVSGAMAVVLLGSALSTKAVETFLIDHASSTS